MKILLTGARGQVGNEIKCSLPMDIQHDIELISLARESFDISCRETVKTIFNQYTPQLVINAAAYTAVDRAEKELARAYAVNTTGALHLAEACKEVDIPLIHLSTDYVFDGSKKTPYIETDPIAPLGIYGKSKWQGETAIRQVLTQHIILRTSWVFGYFGQNFVKTILRLAKVQPELRIVADQYGCPTAARDIATAIWQIIRDIYKKPQDEIPWGTYHYTNKHVVSWYEFTESIIATAKKLTPLSVEKITPITTAEYPTLAQRPAYSVLNCKKIAECFRIQQYPWQIALQEVITQIVR